MQVDVTKDNTEGVRIFRFLNRARPVNPQQVRLGHRHRAAEQTVSHRRELTEKFAFRAGKDVHRVGARREDTNHSSMGRIVRPKEGEGIGEAAVQQSFQQSSIRFIETGWRRFIQHLPILALH